MFSSSTTSKNRHRTDCRMFAVSLSPVFANTNKDGLTRLYGAGWKPALQNNGKGTRPKSGCYAKRQSDQQKQHSHEWPCHKRLICGCGLLRRRNNHRDELVAHLQPSQDVLGSRVFAFLVADNGTHTFEVMAKREVVLAIPERIAEAETKAAARFKVKLLVRGSCEDDLYGLRGLACNGGNHALG